MVRKIDISRTSNRISWLCHLITSDENSIHSLYWYSHTVCIIDLDKVNFLLRLDFKLPRAIYYSFQNVVKIWLNKKGYHLLITKFIASSPNFLLNYHQQCLLCIYFFITKFNYVSPKYLLIFYTNFQTKNLTNFTIKGFAKS